MSEMSPRRIQSYAIKLTTDAFDVIYSKIMDFDDPPSADHLLDAMEVAYDDYYFVKNYPGFSPNKTIAWVLIPEFVLRERFKFTMKESGNMFEPIEAIR